MSGTKPFSALRREDPPPFSCQGTMPHRLPSCLSRVRLVLCWGHAHGKKPRPPVPVPAIWEAMRRAARQDSQERAGPCHPSPSMPQHSGPICCQVQTKGAWKSGPPLSLNSLRKPGGGGQVGLPHFRTRGVGRETAARKEAEWAQAEGQTANVCPHTSGLGLAGPSAAGLAGHPQLGSPA